MRILRPLALAALLFGIPASAHAQPSAGEVIAEMLARFEERAEGVDDYTFVQQAMGTEDTVYFEKQIVDEYPVYVPVSDVDFLLRQIGDVKSKFTEIALLAGMQEFANQLAAASDAQLGTFFRRIADIATQKMMPGFGCETEESDDLASAGTDLLKGVLIQAAEDAAFDVVMGSLMGSSDGQMGAMGELFGAFGMGEAMGAMGDPSSLSKGGMPGLGGPSMAGLAQAGISAAATTGLTMAAGQLLMPDFENISLGMRPAAAPNAQGMLREIGDRARVEGGETIDGHETWLLTVPDPSELDLEDQEGFTPETISFNIDRELYVLRRASVEGEADFDGRKGPMAISVSLEDYRDVGTLLLPFHTVTAIDGLQAAMSEEDRKMLAEMDEQLEKMDEQLKELPPEQRAMAERMLRAQMPKLEQMRAAAASEGPSELAVQVLGARVNTGPPEVNNELLCPSDDSEPSEQPAEAP
jgi:hypothetical protein